jgi:hypothetical protein
MAKNINDIIAEMNVAQSAEPSLSGLNSGSATAIFTLFKKVVATAIAQISLLWDATKKEISEIASSQIYGTKAWYANLAKNYTIVSIGKASCIAIGRKVLIKVAKVSGGITTQLTISELSGLRNYINSKKIVGSDVDVISQTADLCALVLSVQYNGVQASVEADVKTALKNYLNNLAFDANLTKALMIDALLNTSGVVNVYVDELKVDYGTGYLLILGNIAEASAGYFEVGKDSSSNDLITLNMYL